MKTLFEQQGGTFSAIGDYIIPDLCLLVKDYPIGKYDRMRLDFLKRHRRVLYTNLLLPRLDGENETLIIKQSASTMVAMLASFALVGLLVGLFFLAGTNFFIFLLAGIALLAVMNAVVFALLNTHGKKLFAQL